MSKAFRSLLVLVALLSCAAFVGCGGPGPTQSGASDPASEAADQAEAAAFDEPEE